MSKKNKLPEKWYNVYPQGTKTGDEEQKFFISLTRHPKFTWRSIAAISKETGLSQDRVDQIIDKYFDRGIIIQSPSNPDNYGYWENHLDLLEKDKKSISEEDKETILKKAMAKNP